MHNMGSKSELHTNGLILIKFLNFNASNRFNPESVKNQ